MSSYHPLVYDCDSEDDIDLSENQEFNQIHEMQFLPEPKTEIVTEQLESQIETEVINRDMNIEDAGRVKADLDLIDSILNEKMVTQVQASLDDITSVESKVFGDQINSLKEIHDIKKVTQENLIVEIKNAPVDGFNNYITTDNILTSLMHDKIISKNKIIPVSKEEVNTNKIIQNMIKEKSSVLRNLYGDLNCSPPGVDVKPTERAIYNTLVFMDRIVPIPKNTFWFIKFLTEPIDESFLYLLITNFKLVGFVIFNETGYDLYNQDAKYCIALYYTQPFFYYVTGCLNPLLSDIKDSPFWMELNSRVRKVPPIKYTVKAVNKVLKDKTEKPPIRGLTRIPTKEQMRLKTSKKKILKKLNLTPIGQYSNVLNRYELDRI